jgi:hypothetical protein
VLIAVEMLFWPTNSASAGRKTVEVGRVAVAERTNGHTDQRLTRLSESDSPDGGRGLKIVFAKKNLAAAINDTAGSIFTRPDLCQGEGAVPGLAGVKAGAVGRSCARRRVEPTNNRRSALRPVVLWRKHSGVSVRRTMGASACARMAIRPKRSCASRRAATPTPTVGPSCSP